MAKEIYEVNQGCTFCATCLYECPTGAIGMGMDGAVIDPDRCTGCGQCVQNCASEAITKVEKKPRK